MSTSPGTCSVIPSSERAGRPCRPGRRVRRRIPAPGRPWPLRSRQLGGGSPWVRSLLARPDVRDLRSVMFLADSWRWQRAAFATQAAPATSSAAVHSHVRAYGPSSAPIRMTAIGAPQRTHAIRWVTITLTGANAPTGAPRPGASRAMCIEAGPRARCSGGRSDCGALRATRQLRPHQNMGGSLRVVVRGNRPSVSIARSSLS